jgi:von Willebrand factor type A domain
LRVARLCGWLAAVAVVIAASQPSIQQAPRQRVGILTLVVDRSGSTLAADLPPTRLDAIREATLGLLDWVPERVRVGLVAFSDEARTLAQPTTDHDAVRARVASLRPNGGTRRPRRRGATRAGAAGRPRPAGQGRRRARRAAGADAAGRRRGAGAARGRSHAVAAAGGLRRPAQPPRCRAAPGALDRVAADRRRRRGRLVALVAMDATGRPTADRRRDSTCRAGTATPTAGPSSPSPPPAGAAAPWSVRPWPSCAATGSWPTSGGRRPTGSASTGLSTCSSPPATFARPNL